MRLRRLDLTRYGKFTDYSLDFGSAPNKKPDLHIIYGPNEAGKSTALSAYLDLLFGIELHSSYGFKHPYSSMQVGANLNIGTQQFELKRIKKKQHSLLDNSNQPVDPQILNTALAGLSRQEYRTMFSLDDDTLEAGGESILASEGNLGELLYSASAGLSDFSQVLSDVEQELDQIYRPRSGQTRIAQSKQALSEIKNTIRDSDVAASRFRSLMATRATAEQAYEQALAERAATQSKINHLHRLKHALPRLREHQKLIQDIAAMPVFPSVPEQWVAALPQWRDKDIQISTQIELGEKSVAHLRAKLTEIEPNKTALDLAAQVAELNLVHSRYLDALQEMPVLTAELHVVEAEIKSLQLSLDQSDELDANALLLSAHEIGRLQSLMLKQRDQVIEINSAERELKRAEHLFTQRQNEFDLLLNNQSNSQDLQYQRERLKLALAHAESVLSDFAEIKTKEHLLTLKRELEQDMVLLLPWKSDINTLRNLRCPHVSVLEQLKSSAALAQQKIVEHRKEYQRCENVYAECKSDYAALLKTADSFADEHASRIRTERNEAWLTHSEMLNRESADRFKSLLEKDDEISTARLANAAELAQLRQQQRAVYVAEEQLRRAHQQVDNAEREIDRLNQEILDIAVKMSSDLAEISTVDELQSWLEQRAATLARADAISQTEQDIEQFMARKEIAQQSLSDALTQMSVPVEPDADMSSLLLLAKQSAESLIRAESIQNQILQQDQQVQMRKSGLDELREIEHSWRVDWRRACDACWIGSIGHELSVEAVEQIIKRVLQLEPLLKQQKLLVQRIHDLDRHQQDYKDKIAAISAQLNLETSNTDTAAIDSQVRACIDNAVEEQRRYDALQQELAAQEKNLSELTSNAALIKGKVAKLVDLFNVQTIKQVEPLVADMMRKRELQQRVQALELELPPQLHVRTMQQVESVLSEVNENELEVELNQHTERIQNQDLRTRECHTELSKAEDALSAVTGDASVALLEQKKQTLVLELQEDALHFLKLKAGTIAIEQALALYREKYRSAMLKNASEAFSIISSGVYEKLITQPSKGGDILLGQDSDGNSKQAQQMSKGTRFQLYLALRIAGYREYARQHQPVPFIADDIMETFDDNRAEATFRLLADMAQIGQVIYLTHHLHLCEIARRACRDIRIHKLDSTTFSSTEIV